MLEVEVMVRFFFADRYQTFDDLVNYKRYVIDGKDSESLQLFRTSDHYGYLMKASVRHAIVDKLFNVSFQITTNSHGFRFDENKLANADKKSIMMLGDSVTMSYGVNDTQTYPEQVEDSLGDTFNVLNFGVAAWGPVEELVTFNRFQTVVSPDLVVMNIFPQNDFGDVMFSEWPGKSSGALPDTVMTRTDTVVKNGDLAGTALALKYAVPILRSSYAFMFVMEEIEPRIRSFAIFNFFSRKGFVYDITQHLLDKSDLSPEDILVKIINKMYVDTQGRVMVVFFPSLRSYSVGYTPAALKDELKAQCPGLHMVDLFPVFEADFKNLTIDVSHLTARGCQMAAREVSDYLKRQHLFQENSQ